MEEDWVGRIQGNTTPWKVIRRKYFEQRKENGMNVYKIHNDWENFLVVAETIEDALMLGVEQFDELLENERETELADSREVYDKKVSEEKEIPEWLKKALSPDAEDNYKNYEIYQVKKVGKLPSDDEDDE